MTPNNLDTTGMNETHRAREQSSAGALARGKSGLGWWVWFNRAALPIQIWLIHCAINNRQWVALVFWSLATYANASWWWAKKEAIHSTNLQQRDA